MSQILCKTLYITAGVLEETKTLKIFPFLKHLTSVKFYLFSLSLFFFIFHFILFVLYFNSRYHLWSNIKMIISSRWPYFFLIDHILSWSTSQAAVYIYLLTVYNDHESKFVEYLKNQSLSVFLWEFLIEQFIIFLSQESFVSLTKF